MAPHPSTLAWKIPCGPGGRTESDTTERLHFHFSLSCIGEGNGNPLWCSCLETPRDGEPGGLRSTGSHRVGHDWRDLAAAAVPCSGLPSGFWSAWVGCGPSDGLVFRSFKALFQYAWFTWVPGVLASFFWCPRRDGRCFLGPSCPSLWVG